MMSSVRAGWPWALAAACLAAACASGESRAPAAPATPAAPESAPTPVATVSSPTAVTITVLGTNDLHGALDRLPILAGYIDNVRAARAADGGGVVLLDGGDMFQGTLESNLAEGQGVIAAYNKIGYTAATVGNHEFDFGPAGPLVTAKAGEDPRGALKLRATEAKFPLLAGNIVDGGTGARVDWPNMPASMRVDVAGVAVGIIGVTTESTPYTTMPANFAGLRMAKAAEVIKAEAARLREGGARVVVVVGHIGTKCKDHSDPADASSCDAGEELHDVLGALPPGTIDVFVGGHTHAPVSKRIADVAVIESYSNGRAFGRVDLRVELGGGAPRVTGVKIFPPQLLCPLGADGNPPPAAACQPEPYEGRPTVPSQAISTLIEPYREAAKTLREQPLGVQLADPIWKRYDSESPQGNLIADLMRAAQPGVDLALTNGGGLRADLPAGPLTYGRLYEAQPFDNRFAILTLRGKDLEAIVASNLATSSGVLSWSGMTVRARCKGSVLEVQLFDAKRRRIGKDRVFKVATSDFLASGGEGSIARLGLTGDAVRITDIGIRDAIADVLRTRGGTIRTLDAFDPRAPRLDYPAPRPVTCKRAAP